MQTASQDAKCCVQQVTQQEDEYAKDDSNHTYRGDRIKLGFYKHSNRDVVDHHRDCD